MHFFNMMIHCLFGAVCVMCEPCFSDLRVAWGREALDGEQVVGLWAFRCKM